ncbi:MAG: FAD-dependent oxidoreductase [Pseudomonadota bacterium]
MPSPNPHIAIVGTGVAGLMAGRRLRELLPNSRIAFYDAASQSGGRLKSIVIKDDVEGAEEIVELGGARFHPEHHPMVHALLEQLEIPTRDYQCALSPVHRAYFGYVLDVLRDILQRLQASFKEATPAEQSYLSFGDAAARFLGSDARDLIATAVGYDTLLHPNMSFASGMELLRQHPETSTLWGGHQGWLTPAKGFQSLTHALEAELRQTCTFHYGRSLRTFTSSAVCCQLGFDCPTGHSTEIADYVILAVAMRDLEHVSGARVPKVVSDAVIDVPLAKGYFTFDAPWWTDLGLKGQCFTTATAFRKIYFPAQGRSVQIYSDGPSARLLQELVAKSTREEIAREFSAALQDAVSIPMSTQRVLEAQSGWAFWERGVSFWKPGLRLMPPDCLAISDRHYFCSDLCTTSNGWVEGALVSADATARKIAEHARQRALQLDDQPSAETAGVRA